MDNHRGKGPRGYRRTDARTLEDVNERLADDPSVDATDIEVTVKDAEVTLSGHAADRFEKRRERTASKMPVASPMCRTTCASAYQAKAAS